jgi:hypothetical protein
LRAAATLAVAGSQGFREVDAPTAGRDEAAEGDVLQVVTAEEADQIRT